MKVSTINFQIITFSPKFKLYNKEKLFYTHQYSLQPMNYKQFEHDMMSHSFALLPLRVGE